MTFNQANAFLINDTTRNPRIQEVNMLYPLGRIEVEAMERTIHQLNEPYLNNVPPRCFPLGKIVWTKHWDDHIEKHFNNSNKIIIINELSENIYNNGIHYKNETADVKFINIEPVIGERIN